jgi:hypothetical protein
MALLVELMHKLDQGYEKDESKRVSFQRDVVLWAINQPEVELRDQLADASDRLERCSSHQQAVLEREQQNCLLALQAREFFLNFGQTLEFDDFIAAVV